MTEKLRKQELKLVSPLPPSVNHYLAPRIYYEKKNSNKTFQSGKARVMMYETSEAKAYKRNFTWAVAQEVIKQNWVMSDNRFQHVYCDCVFYFDRIDEDPNNYFKLPLDAITDAKNVWIDDNIVRERVQRIYYVKKDPRIEMTIHFVDDIGIFDNEDDYSVFLNKCASCSRFRGGACSLLKHAAIGGIQAEIKDKQCSKYTEKKGFKNEQQ